MLPECAASYRSRLHSSLQSAQWWTQMFNSNHIVRMGTYPTPSPSLTFPPHPRWAPGLERRLYALFVPFFLIPALFSERTHGLKASCLSRPRASALPRTTSMPCPSALVPASNPRHDRFDVNVVSGGEAAAPRVVKGHTVRVRNQDNPNHSIAEYGTARALRILMPSGRIVMSSLEVATGRWGCLERHAER